MARSGEKSKNKKSCNPYNIPGVLATVFGVAALTAAWIEFDKISRPETGRNEGFDGHAFNVKINFKDSKTLGKKFSETYNIENIMGGYDRLNQYPDQLTGSFDKAVSYANYGKGTIEVSETSASSAFLRGAWWGLMPWEKSKIKNKEYVFDLPVCNIVSEQSTVSVNRGEGDGILHYPIPDDTTFTATSGSEKKDYACKGDKKGESCSLDGNINLASLDKLDVYSPKDGKFAECELPPKKPTPTPTSPTNPPSQPTPVPPTPVPPTPVPPTPVPPTPVPPTPAQPTPVPPTPAQPTPVPPTPAQPTPVQPTPVPPTPVQPTPPPTQQPCAPLEGPFKFGDCQQSVCTAPAKVPNPGLYQGVCQHGGSQVTIKENMLLASTECWPEGEQETSMLFRSPSSGCANTAQANLPLIKEESTMTLKG